TRSKRDWSSDVCSSDLVQFFLGVLFASVLDFVILRWCFEFVLALCECFSYVSVVLCFCCMFGLPSRLVLVFFLWSCFSLGFAFKIGRASCREGVLLFVV